MRKILIDDDGNEINRPMGGCMCGQSLLSMMYETDKKKDRLKNYKG